MNPTAAWPRLLALDVDGTIVDFDGKLTDRVRDAVRAIAETGRHIVLSTGRSPAATIAVAHRLGLTAGYAVTSNGAVTVRLDPEQDRGYAFVDVVTFDPTDALAVLREHLPQAVYAVEDVRTGFRVTEPFPAGELDGPMTVVPFEELVDGGRITRVVVRSPEHTLQDFLDIIKRLGLHGGTYTVGWTAWLDVAPEGVSKAHGLQVVAQELGLKGEDVLAVGDGRNDLEMFAWAGRAVAMGQAPPVVRSAADQVCGTVAEDGLADVLEALLQ